MDEYEGREYEEQEEGSGSSDAYVRVEISGLSLFTHHGVTDAEQQAGGVRLRAPVADDDQHGAIT